MVMLRKRSWEHRAGIRDRRMHLEMIQHGLAQLGLLMELTVKSTHPRNKPPRKS